MQMLSGETQPEINGLMRVCEREGGGDPAAGSPRRELVDEVCGVGEVLLELFLPPLCRGQAVRGGGGVEKREIVERWCGESGGEEGADAGGVTWMGGGPAGTPPSLGPSSVGGEGREGLGFRRHG